MPVTAANLDEKLTNAKVQREQLVGQLNQITGVILILEQLQREESAPSAPTVIPETP